jgi:DNA-binding IclR family transcriptional regulator
VPIDLAPGRRATIEDTAAGDVLLSFASPRRRRRYAQGRPRGAADTEVIAHLDGVRLAGYAVSRPDPSSMWASVAAPFHDASGEVVGALALIGPRSRLTDERLRELTPAVSSEAAAISRALTAEAGSPSKD